MRATWLTDEGANRLREAVVKQAVVDYKSALYRYNTAKGRGTKLKHRRTILECERFFLNDLELYCDLDGRAILRALRKEVEENLEKKEIKMEVPSSDGSRII